MSSFRVTKTSLAILNVFYILVAFILIGTATYGRFSNKITNLAILGGIVFCGVFLLFLAIVGLWSTYKHHQVLLFFYMIILFSLFVVQFSIAAACLSFSVYRQENLAKRGWLLASDKLKINVQDYFNCCGFQNNTMPFEPSSINPLGHPTCSKLSCCVKAKGEAINAACCTDKSMPSNTTAIDCPCSDCWTKLHARMQRALKRSGGYGMFFSFTLLIGIFLSLKFRNMKDPYVDFNPSAFPPQ